MQNKCILNVLTIFRICKGKENEGTKKAPSLTNKKQGIKQFKKLDDFDLSIIRRTVHSYFSRKRVQH